jgi:hypothetical protein
VPSKKIPTRKSRIAEEYAKKVRVEPPKATRQEVPTADTREYSGVPGQHDHGPKQRSRNKKFPEGGKAAA